MGLDVTGLYRYPPYNAAWLRGHCEDVIEPQQEIIDAHHHLWEEAGQPYLFNEIGEDLASGHNVSATVFVQAHFGYRDHGPEPHRCVGETERAAAIAEQAKACGATTDICAAIVAFADLTRGNRVGDVIEDHLLAAKGRLRGIRHSVSRDPHFPNGIVIRPAPAKLLGDAVYRAGLAQVSAYGLSYDAMLYHCQIPELADMADALPDLPIVLDHFGCILGVGPYAGRQAEIFHQWKADLATLAERPNVSVKLGGMGMIVCGARWHERTTPPGSAELAVAWTPYVETCIELFGVDRCMFESNFPVDKSQYSYRVVWNAFKRIAAGASESEKRALFHNTAARFYRIERKASAAR